jgi:hypothetical protein
VKVTGWLTFEEMDEEERAVMLAAGITSCGCWRIAPLLAKFGSGPKFAEMVRLPAGSANVTQIAFPVVGSAGTAAHPVMTFPPFRKTTWPVSCPAGPDGKVRAAVRVTNWLTTEVPDELKAILVVAAPTLKGGVAFILAL